MALIDFFIYFSAASVPFRLAKCCLKLKNFQFNKYWKSWKRGEIQQQHYEITMRGWDILLFQLKLFLIRKFYARESKNKTKNDAVLTDWSRTLLIVVFGVTLHRHISRLGNMVAANGKVTAKRMGKRPELVSVVVVIVVVVVAVGFEVVVVVVAEVVVVLITTRVYLNIETQGMKITISEFVSVRVVRFNSHT